MQRKAALITGAFSATATFALGFGIMNILWRTLGTSGELPGLFYYKAATIGDGICLPIFIGASTAFVRYNKSLKACSHKVSTMLAIIASFIATMMQASWLINDDTVLNWSIPISHHFNLAGWYHSLFFIGMFGIVTYQLSEIWHVIQKKQIAYSWFEKILYMLWVLSGTMFVLMLVSDDYGQYFPVIPLLSEIATGVLILIIIYLKSAGKQYGKELLSVIFAGILGAYSISLFICVPVQGDIAIALGGGLCACFLWRVEKFSLSQIVCKDIWTVMFYSCALYVISGMHNIVELLCASLFLCVITIINEKLFIGEVRYRSASLIVIEIYIIISALSRGVTTIGELIEPIFTIIVYFLFDKEIRDYFSAVVNAEEEQNRNQITKIEFKQRKEKAYFQIILGILAIIILVSRWLLDIAKSSGMKIEVGTINIPVQFIMALLISVFFLLLLGMERNRKYLISKVITFFLICIMFLILILINVVNMGVLPSLVWTPIKWIMLACSICACLGSAILSAHGYYMNVVWLRGLEKKDWARAMAFVQLIGGIILNLFATVLILCCQTWAHLILILVVTIMAFIVMPALSARVIQYEHNGSYVVRNSPLGGIAQDGLMITLVVFFAAYIPCVYISIINVIDRNAILGAGALICAAFSPVGFCIHNNVEHIERQKKVLIDHPEEEELWNTLRKCLVRQSKQTIFAMLPYVCIATFFEIVKRIGKSKTISEAIKDIKNIYIDKEI